MIIKPKGQYMRNIQKKLMGLALGFCIGLIFSLTGQVSVANSQVYKSAKPELREDYWQARQKTISNQLKNTKDLSSVKLVFIGDSITDFWSLDENPWAAGKYCGLQIWNQSFVGTIAENNALNLGISGDRTEHILHRLEPLVNGGLGHLDRTDLNPDFIIILAGINNSYNPEKPAIETIYAGVEAIIRSVHARKPKARIVLQTLLPTGDKVRNHEIVAPLNKRLRQLSQSAEFSSYVDFFDLHKAFVDKNDQQISLYFNDDLHPNKIGYSVWRDALIAHLDKLRR
jgi:lysophospholipase L1-like esterase